MSSSLLFGVGNSVLSSLIWGMYPVLSRYIMRNEDGHPQSLSLLAVLMTFNALLVGAAYLFIPKKTKEQVPPSLEPEVSNITKRNVALAYGFLCICRMTTNMQSTRMTKAYNTQMTAMSLPFFTSILARIFLNETIHPALFPALLVMLVGSICVFYGQGAFSSSGENSVEESFTNEDIAGIALQLLSVLFSSLVKIAFKSTEGVLSKIELLLSQFTVSAFPLLCYTLIYQRDSFYSILFKLDRNGWMCLLGLAFGVYIIGNYTQIVAARLIGASNHSASNSIRLLAAVVGSALVLREPVTSSVEIFGIALVIIALGVYWYTVHRTSFNSSDGSNSTTGNTVSDPRGDYEQVTNPIEGGNVIDESEEGKGVEMAEAGDVRIK